MVDRRDVVREAGQRHLEILRTNRANHHVALNAIGDWLEEGATNQEEEVPAGKFHGFVQVICRRSDAFAVQGGDLKAWRAVGESGQETAIPTQSADYNTTGSP